MHDFHIHTHYSSDSRETMEAHIQQAIQLNLKEICFTDHVEFDPAPPFVEEFPDVKAYSAEIKRLQEMYKNKLQIRKGCEIGYQPHVLDRMNAYATSTDFDFIIASLHGVDKLDLHTGPYFKGKTQEEAATRYFEAYYQCVKDNPIYSVLGHFDLLKRYEPFDGTKLFKDNYDIIKTTFQLLISNGKGIEINTSGHRYRLGHTLPTLDILKLYKQLGGEIITTGSDAHRKQDLAMEFDGAHALLREAGFDYYTRFEGMKPEFVSLDEQKKILKYA